MACVENGWKWGQFLGSFSCSLMIDLKDAVNLVSNKDLLAQFQQLGHRRRVLSGLFAICQVYMRSRVKKPISAPFSDSELLRHFSFHLGDTQDGYLKPHSQVVSGALTKINPNFQFTDKPTKWSIFFPKPQTFQRDVCAAVMRKIEMTVPRQSSTNSNLVMILITEK